MNDPTPIAPDPTPIAPNHCPTAGLGWAGPYTVVPGQEGTYQVTITAVFPNAPSSPDGWDFDTLLEYLSASSDLVSEVSAVRLVPEVTR